MASLLAFMIVSAAIAAILRIFSSLIVVLNRSPASLIGKCAIVTGGNGGIGFQVCLDLASRGCKVIIADVTDATESCKKIIEQTGNPNVIGKYLNLASFKSVRKFAAEIIATEEKLDILINNAGVGTHSDIKTEDGLNPVMQINYFGPFLLTTLLLDLLKKSAPSRIIFTSSILAYIGRVSPENLTLVDESPTLLLKYNDSKLACNMSAKVLAEKLKDTGVTCNCVSPGYVRSPIFLRSFKTSQTILVQIVILLLLVVSKILGRDVWEGAQTLNYAAMSKEVENVSGKFFGNCGIIPHPIQAADMEKCKKVWRVTEEYFSKCM